MSHLQKRQNPISTALLLALLFIAGSCTDHGPKPVLSQVTPSEVVAEQGAAIAIAGSNFTRVVQVLFDDDHINVSSEFRVRLVSDEHSQAAETVQWVDAGLLTAEVPAGIPVGVYDLEVVDPSGYTARLADAVRVLATVPPKECETAAECDDGDPCTSSEACLAGVCQSGPRDKDADGDGAVDALCGGSDCDDEPTSCGAACVPADGAWDGCDSYDNDCDGQTDEDGGTVWFSDLDGDGIGDDASGELSCAPLPGLVGQGGDCDDNPAICGAACSPDVDADICDGHDNDCDGETDEDPNATLWYPDVDGDGVGRGQAGVPGCAGPLGYVLTNDDCDDSPASCGAACSPDHDGPDACDGYDNDCDGETDEDDGTVWFVDLDGDGVGDSAGPQTACEQPIGYAAIEGDCDDDPTGCGAACSTAPVVDACDGYDNDCDGETDEDDGTVWFVDLDGDGVGDSAGPLTACEQPTGYAANDGDCDDNPASCGAACSNVPGTDACDGHDNDCDGTTDEDGDILWWRDEDEDGYGIPEVTTVGCDPGVGWVQAPTTGDGIDCNDLINTVFPGTACDDGAACTTSDLCGNDGICKGFDDCGTGLAIVNTSSGVQAFVWADKAFASGTLTTGAVGWNHIESARSTVQHSILVAGLTDDKTIQAMTLDGGVWTTAPSAVVLTDCDHKDRPTVAALMTASGALTVLTAASDSASYATTKGDDAWEHSDVPMNTSGHAHRVDASPHPTQNSAIVAVTTGDGKYALIWNGASFQDEVVIAETSNSSLMDCATAHERLSGRGMVICGADASPNLLYRLRNGNTWSSGATVAAPSGVAGEIHWSRLAADPTSNRLGMVALSDEGGGSAAVWFVIWDGAQWLTPVTPGTIAINPDHSAVDIAFNSLGRAVVVWSDQATDMVQAWTWGADGGWQTTSGLAVQDPTSLRLYPRGTGPTMMLGALTLTGDVVFSRWDATTFQPPTLLGGGNASKTEPFTFTWTQ